MRLTLFRLGLAVTVMGIGVTAFLFAGAQKTTESFILDIAQTGSSEQYLEAGDIGFFRVYSPNFGGEPIFVQVIDPGENIIADKKVETRMAINYFDIEQDGVFSVKATNLSSNAVYFEVEYGQTGAEKLRYPGIMILAGVILVVVASYRRLRDYSMAQPDENAS